jgi:hypothetical protein
MQSPVTGTFFFCYISVDEMQLALQNIYMGVKLASLQQRNGNEEFRGILVLKAEAVKRDCRKFHNEKLHSTYSWPNIVRVVKSRVRWVGACRMQDDGKHILKLWLDNMNRDHMGEVNKG